MEYIKHLKKLLFIDIETVPIRKTYQELSPDMQQFWTHKSGFIAPDKLPAESFTECAGIYAEFAKVTAVGFGFFRENTAQEIELRVKSIWDTDEKSLLEEFSVLLNKFKHETLLVGHHAKEFDFPFLCRRILVNGLPLPSLLPLQGRKPWEIKHLDTMEMWKFGDHKKFTPLPLLAEIFGIEANMNLDEHLIYKLYYQTENYAEIAKHCQKNVMLTAQLYLCLQNYPRLKSENISITS